MKIVFVLILGVQAGPVVIWPVNSTITNAPTTTNDSGELSAEQKAVISQNWGFNIDARRSRLQALIYPEAQAAMLTGILQPELSDKLVPIETTRPTPDAVGNAFEANSKAGISEYLWNGDIQLTEDQLEALEDDAGVSTSGRKKRQIRPLSTRWTNNTVYYFIDTSINVMKTDSINSAINFLQKNTCLRFVNDKTAPNRVRIYSGTGCFSTVGMVGGQQDVSLGDGCEAVGTVVHELMHALGVYHTQMRWDRDYYSNYFGNFAKAKFTDAVQPSYVPYDYSSVMHYAANSFTNPTSNLSIVPSDPRYAYGIGNTMVSFYDIKQINDHYGCSATCKKPACASCLNRGVPNPNNCFQCICPDGYAGDLCDQKPMDCGKALNATTSWQTAGFTVGTSSSSAMRTDFARCTYWISAPPGSQIQVQITNMWNEQCSWGCLWSGVMFKTEWDQRISSPKYCCTSFMNQIFTSNLNPAPLIGYNKYYYSLFNFQYRYVPAPKIPITGNSCSNTLSDDTCAGNNAEGFCTSANYTFQVRKYSCASTCGLCGVAATPCVDIYSPCTASLCKALGAMGAEYYCAKSCGFCEYPN